MRRFVTIALSLSLVLGLSALSRLAAQDEKKAAEPEKKADAEKKPEPDKKADAEKKPEPEIKAEPEKKAEAPAPPVEKPIPPAVQAKIDAARKAVAEAIVAAEQAGLVDSTIDPPPILDILLTGRATDGAVLRAAAEKVKAKPAVPPEAAVSLEVFGAWHTGNNAAVEGVTAKDNVRILPPSKGLSELYRARSELLKPLIEEARKHAAPAEPKKEADKKADEPKKEADKKADEPKKEADKKADEPKKDESKKDESEKKADEPKKDESKKDEPKL